MINNYYWISAPCFAIVLVIILLKEYRWLKSPDPLARSLYAMLFFAMLHSLPVSAIDLCISKIVDDRILFFPMELVSLVTSAVLFVFWLNFILRYVKARPTFFYGTITISALMALTGAMLVVLNLCESNSSPHPIVSYNVEIWRKASILFRNAVMGFSILMALKRIHHQLRKKEKIKTRYIASFIAALVPFAIDMMFFGNTPICSLTLSTSCLILYIYFATNERIELQHSKEMFLENMSHEIRTTLNSVYGFAQLLCLPEGTWSAEERLSYASHIHNSYNMLDMLLNDLMVATRYDTHNYTVQKEPTYVMGVVADAVNAVKVCIPSSVEIHISSELPNGFTIMSDGRRIRQIVQNLLTNVSQHIVEGKIQVRLMQKGHTMKIIVTAENPNSANESEQLKKEEEMSITKHKTGLGLRLLICRKIAKLIGGSVKRETNYTKGIKYEFKLKASQVKPSANESVMPPKTDTVEAEFRTLLSTQKK